MKLFHEERAISEEVGEDLTPEAIVDNFEALSWSWTVPRIFPPPCLHFSQLTFLLKQKSS